MESRRQQRLVLNHSKSGAGDKTAAHRCRRQPVENQRGVTWDFLGRHEAFAQCFLRRMAKIKTTMSLPFIICLMGENIVSIRGCPESDNGS